MSSTTTQYETGAERPAIIFARVAGLLVALIGAAVLVGWHLEAPLHEQGFPSSITMKANAAVGFILAGLGVFTLTFRLFRPLARVFGFLLLIGAGATLSQDIFGMDLRIDEALFTDPVNPDDVRWPGRVSPGASLAFTLMGGALLLTAYRSIVLKFITEVMLVITMVVAITNLIGHTYEFPQFYDPFTFTAMPLQMAVILALTAIGISAACPDRGFARAVSDTSAGGHMFRRLLPGIIVIPVMLGWLVHKGLMTGLYNEAVGTAVLAVATIVVMAGFGWLTAVALRRADQEREHALVELHSQREGLRTTLVSIADAVIATDGNGAIELMNPVAEKLTGWSLDRARHEPVTEVFRAAEESSMKLVEDPTVRAQREQQVVELSDCVLLMSDGRSIPIECVCSPILNTKGKPAGAVLIFRDITGRRRAEEQQQMLVSELNHRVRNLLMIVQSIVQASAQYTGSRSAKEMTEVLAQRLQSLSRAHELLLDTQWSGASLKRMVELELEPFREEGSSKVKLRGRDVLLPPQCTSVVAMALHELTTNAAKYGALKNAEGRLNVSWNVNGSTLTIKWRENGTKVSEERETGFGMRLIDKGIRQNLGGNTDLNFKQDGLVVTMRLPIDEPAGSKGRSPGRKQPAHDQTATPA